MDINGWHSGPQAFCFFFHDRLRNESSLFYILDHSWLPGPWYLGVILSSSKYAGFFQAVVAMHGLTKNAIIFYNVCSCWFIDQTFQGMSTMNIVQRYKKDNSDQQSQPQQPPPWNTETFRVCKHAFRKEFEMEMPVMPPNHTLPRSLHSAVNLYSLVYTNQS